MLAPSPPPPLLACPHGTFNYSRLLNTSNGLVGPPDGFFPGCLLVPRSPVLEGSAVGPSARLSSGLPRMQNLYAAPGPSKSKLACNRPSVSWEVRGLPGRGGADREMFWSLNLNQGVHSQGTERDRQAVRSVRVALGRKGLRLDSILI